MIPMGGWRDSSQPNIEETGTVGNCRRNENGLKTGGLRRHGMVCSLDTGRLMGGCNLYQQTVTEEMSCKTGATIYVKTHQNFGEQKVGLPKRSIFDDRHPGKGHATPEKSLICLFAQSLHSLGRYRPIENTKHSGGAGRFITGALWLTASGHI
ncbi:MAG: hypothetical protein WBX11_16995 [Thiobacillaceae bacterium]